MKKIYFMPQIAVIGMDNMEVLTASVEVTCTDDWTEEDLFFEFTIE